MKDLAPRLGIKPRSPALGVLRLSHRTTREAPYVILSLLLLVDLHCSLGRPHHHFRPGELVHLKSGNAENKNSRVGRS